MSRAIPLEYQRVTHYDDGMLDEVVLCGVDIHLERMSDGSVWLGVYRPDSEVRLSVWLTASRKDVLTAFAKWDGEADESPWDGVGI